jgi:hypothetical protein
MFRGDESMAEKNGERSSVMVNQPPVLTLWAAVVAEALGFEHGEIRIPKRKGCCQRRSAPGGENIDFPRGVVASKAAIR